MQGLLEGRKMPHVFLPVLLALAALAAAGPRGAVAAETHVFDPVLSLTGGCKTSTVDPVPDPPPAECGSGAHPPAPFATPLSVVTDSYGNIFVANYGTSGDGRIDIFDSKGFFITEIPDSNGPKNLAVDSEGNLYVFDFDSNEIVRYTPAASYEPATGDITYEGSPDVVPSTKNELSTLTGIAINRANDHLFVHKAEKIAEYGSAKEENKLLDETIGKGILSNPIGLAIGLAVDPVHKRIYASSSNVVKVLELEAPHNLVMTIEGSATPLGHGFANGISLAVDEGTGHFFVFDGGGSNAVYEFSIEGAYLSTIEYKIQHIFGAEISIDNGPQSPNGALNPFGRYLFIPSHPTEGHSFAFGPPSECEPKLEAASAVGTTETEAQLQATINPCGLETTYTLEYTTAEGFEAEGFEGATVAASGSIPASGSPFEVSAALEGLTPDTAFVFRAVAENEKGNDEVRGEFATYPQAEAPPACPNNAFRVGPSELLPDCRAYELVTPPDTNGRNPLGVGYLGSAYFATREVSPDGGAVSFEIEGGQIPGFEATGSYAGDPYVSKRGSAGWGTEYAGPNGEEAPALLPGSNSPDQGYSFWGTASGEGTAAVEGKPSAYVRYPDGRSELIGRGSLGTDPQAAGRLIAENGNHILFSSTMRLEEEAPAGETVSIYDRTADEVTHVVSLLPGDEIPDEGEKSFYEGASLDGKGVAFRLGGTIPTSPLYFRYNNEETYEVAGAGATFAGFAKEGKRIFYLEGGNLYAYEVEGDANPIAFSTSGDVTPVNVAEDGNVAYFISPSVLTGEPNPRGDLPEAGKENLYRSDEDLVSFVGTVTKRDVEGENPGNVKVDGLGLWTVAVGPGQLGKDPSRTTPDGQVLLFESRADLTGYEPEGHAEIYRYDSSTNELDCISCNPTLAPATGDASLQSIAQEQGAPEPGSSFVLMNNLRADGNRAFFQSIEPLVLADTDELQDIYEWEAQGVGSCERAGGCVYLISSGHSKRIDYLWGVSDSGDDVFFRSSDLLLGIDTDETPSIYDARVNGGFAEPVVEEECREEGCRPNLLSPPPMLPPESGVHPSGPEVKSCPKGKHKVIRNGKPVCVKNKKKHHKKHHRKASKKRGAAK